MKQAQAQWQFPLRLPADYREPLAKLAKANDRSTNAEIRHALKKHLERIAERDRWRTYD